MPQSGSSGHSPRFPPPMWSPSIPPPSFVPSAGATSGARGFPPALNTSFSFPPRNNAAPVPSCTPYQQGNIRFNAPITQVPPPAAPYSAYNQTHTQQMGRDNRYISCQNQTSQKTKASSQPVYVPPYPPPVPPGTPSVSFPANFPRVQTVQSNPQWSNDAQVPLQTWYSKDLHQNSVLSRYDSHSSSHRNLPFGSDVAKASGILPQSLNKDSLVNSEYAKSNYRGRGHSAGRHEYSMYERRDRLDGSRETHRTSEESVSRHYSPHRKQSCSPNHSNESWSSEMFCNPKYGRQTDKTNYWFGSSSNDWFSRRSSGSRHHFHTESSRHSKSPDKHSPGRSQRQYLKSPARKQISVDQKASDYSVISSRGQDASVPVLCSNSGESVRRSCSPKSNCKPEKSKEESKKECSERDALLQKWRQNYCSDISEMQMKLEELSKMKPEEILEHERNVWTRSTPADLYYRRDEENVKVKRATPKLVELCDKFEHDIVKRAQRVRMSQQPYEPPPRKRSLHVTKHKSEASESSCSSSEESSTDEEDYAMEELERKRQHPYRLHPEMWFNDPGEMNDGPLCRCSARARRSGIRHGIYAGEGHLHKCDVNTNNADRLYHYHITISPPTNFLTKTPTIIKHDEHEFIFEGFSMFSHFPLHNLPTCKVIRFNIEYTILYIEENLPENFTIHELDLFYTYLFKEILELMDLDFHAHSDPTGCAQFHFMPRFVRDLPDNGKEILSMNEVLLYLMDNSYPLIEENLLEELDSMSQYRWQNFANEVKGMVVTHPGLKPCSVRVDQLDRDQQEEGAPSYPEIVHFGIRPPQLSYAGNAEYQETWKEYVKLRHLLANMPKPSFEDKRKLEAKEHKLQEMRTQHKMKRDVTVAVSSKGFYRTGIMCDIIQHAMLIPVLMCHLRFHRSCNVLEESIGYKFENRFLLQLALTHPSYRENFGTNPDHVRNSLANCGIRQLEYGDIKIHYMKKRKRGINALIDIMSRFGKKAETESNVSHNERLEFLGDAVVEFISSVHLFHMFQDLEEGGLATYRTAIVQNQHLAVLAKTLKLEDYMLYAHGSDLCHDSVFNQAMANCFEALMGALFLDGGTEVADKVFSETLFKEDPDLLDTWVNYPPHPLQAQEPMGDRKWIPSFEILQKLAEFEESVGIEFKHIRLLARAFTHQSIGYTNLTLGSNQRLEFLGDSVLQLIVTEYLYKYFPEHHEGHLSLLRSSLVNNKTQAVVCDDLGMTNYALHSKSKAEWKIKDKADLMEAFLGALYVDQGLLDCEVLCKVCIFPRLQHFIMNQDWNDPKSKLQQCCLTLRPMEGGEPDIPLYKAISTAGSSATSYCKKHEKTTSAQAHLDAAQIEDFLYSS